MPEAPFVPVIPAGGSGTRLWPLSRRAHPKFLLDLTGSGSSLLRQTVDRLAPLADAPPIVVTGAAHAPAVTDQVGRSTRVVAEPSPRNSMPAIALAAALVERDHPGAVIGSFAADHLIADREGFARSVATARDAAERGYLVTLGIRPTEAATGFGYIEVGEDGGDPRLAGTGASPVAAFVEKPDRATAETFLASGRHLWNAGMFVVGAAVLLDALAEQMPPLAAGARRIAAALADPDPAVGREELARTWPTLTSIAIDHALAEPLAARGRVAVVPATFDWDDVGDFAALARQLRSGGAGPGVHGPSGADGAATAPGEDGRDDVDVRVLGSVTVDALASRATVYGASQRRVALVGVDGISVVDTEDAVLVIADEHAQDLAALVSGFAERGLGHLR